MWIEISLVILASFSASGHSLRGLCGLKCLRRCQWPDCDESQPARAVWIEIPSDAAYTDVDLCHSLRGLCGLKYVDVSMYITGH